MVKYRRTHLSRTYAALADPTRRAVLARVREHPGAAVSAIAQGLPVKLPGVMKHLDVLEEAGLIQRVKIGRVVTVRLAPGSLREAFCWLREYRNFWTGNFGKSRSYVEVDD